MKTAARLQRRLAPPPRLTISEWADGYRRLSPEGSAEPGRWDTSRAEYQRGVMDAISDPRVERVVLMTSARVGKTEALNNCVGYHIAQDPASMLVVLPTEQRADEWVDDAFDPMVRDTPALRSVLGDRKSRKAGDRRKHRAFPGGRLYVVGANAPSGLAAKTVRLVLMDEVDRFPASAGEEGDPVTLAEKRAATAWNRKIILSSTPTIAGRSRIETAFEASDRRRFWVPCADCGQMQTLRWAQVRWDEGRPDTAAYHCEGCGAAWTDADRHAAVRRGEWRAEGEFRGVAGFHLNELYSPWRRLAETARDFLAAKDSPARLMPWVNTALGETWQDRGDAPEFERLLERAQDYPEATAPVDALALTAGVDVQGSRLELYVWAWGRGLTSWLVGREVFDGDPTQAAVWDALRARLDEPVRREGGAPLRVLRCGVDTGFATAAVYAQLRRLRDPRLMPLKGVERSGATSPVTGPTTVDVTEAGRKTRGGLKIWTVAVSTFKSELYRRLWLKREGDEFPTGWVHLPRWVGSEPIKQLVAEQLVTVKDKRGFTRQEWQKLRERNEALDCTVYARAALWVAGADRRGERFWDALAAELDAADDEMRPARPAAPVVPPMPEPAAAPMAPRSSGWLQPRGNWLRR